MRTSTSTSTRRAARTGLAVVVLALAAACGSGDDDDGRVGPDKGAKAPKTATGSLEDLARQAECEPNIQTDAEELRQANCTTADGKYILATFATDRGQREWINEANDYGGTYLVGRKWVAVGDEKVVAALRDRLGGTVETGAQHGSGHGGEGGDSGDGGGDSGGVDDHDGHDGHEGHDGGAESGEKGGSAGEGHQGHQGS
ncbi:hypothetical protein GLX30_25525 [Streptomyces sp. Tu 2975]|uniref:hypothetical protein n=1 Tax=Streptomyces sp. Tu 2975 TaxID=2676871 RepID=UPI0013572ABC|nr:hypothetical protein [Streptomyces sp. Tu 2975]QIP86828.1 hypothetical protein GLX30_25525 [Streptomyces sp. Tu 2975]